MGWNAVKKLHFLGGFPDLEKNAVHKKWGLCFFHSISLPCLGHVIFQSTNFWTPLSVTSSYMLEPGFYIWLPGILWYYNLHQTNLFKDFAPKKSNLVNSLVKTLAQPSPQSFSYQPYELIWLYYMTA